MVPALFVTAPHASDTPVEWLLPRLAVPLEALAEAVDVGTGEVARTLDADAVLLGPVSRLICDLDHEIPDDNRPDRRFSLEDTRGRPLWDEPLTLVERDRLVREIYRPWYHEARQTREALIRRFGRLAHLDLNTWGGEVDGPPLLLANGGHVDTAEGERTSCAAPAMLALAEELRRATGLEVGINRRFKGGGVLRTFGHHPGSTVQLSWHDSLYARRSEPERAAFTQSLRVATRAWLDRITRR